MVKAILAGKKTMTRRVVKNKIFQQWIDVGMSDEAMKNPDNNWIDACPYGQPGDILWVRETWNQALNTETDELGYVYKEQMLRENVIYTDLDDDPIKWRPSIFMPRTAARLFLKVTNIRVERLQDISQEDIEKEGLWFYSQEYREETCINRDSVYGIQATGRKYFKELWDSINAKRGYGWDINPWVWVVEFERVERK